MTGFPLILTIALAAAFVLVAVGLIVSLLYYKGRLVDSHRTLARIIKENLELHEKLDDPEKE